MKKHFLAIFFFIFCIFCNFYLKSEAIFPGTMANLILRAGLEKKSVIAISVRNLKTGRNIYTHHSKKLLNPASALKTFTFAVALDTLGEDYKFKTEIYADKKNNLYIKLGADPLLSYDDLRSLVKSAKTKYNFKKVKRIYIDDTVIDKIPYPNGWMIDDINMPKISPYTLDNNMVHILVEKRVKTAQIDVFQPSVYKLAIINEIKKGIDDDIKISRAYGENNDIVTLSGTFYKKGKIDIAINNPKFYFVANLDEIFKREKIEYKNKIFNAKTPSNARKIAEVSHSMQDIGRSVLFDSNNFAAEIVFKVAGAKYMQKPTGTTEYGVQMFENYYKNAGLSFDDVKIVDGSGVSRYNLFNTEWLSDALCYIGNNTNIKNYMAQPGEGTLRSRLRHLRGKLYAKTGTLSSASSLVGFVQAKRKRWLSFVVIIQNFNKKPSYVKSFEDDIIDMIHKM